jgi:ribonuclease HI
MTTPEVTIPEDVKRGAVIYFDGGCNPTNPGPMGSGVHGYVFQHTPPKKGSGNPSVVLTNFGYVSKSDKAKIGKTYRKDGRNTYEITPECYIDIIYSQQEHATNNYAELTGAIEALNKLSEFALSDVIMLGDSEYVIKNIDRCDMWAANYWIKPDNQPVKNVELWKLLHAKVKEFRSKGIHVEFAWVKGHDNGEGDSYGNLIADTFASVGTKRSAMLNCKTDIRVSSANGYWKDEVSKNPFIANRRMYFETDTAFHTPGEYFLGEHGSDDDMLGKRLADGAYSVVKLKEPEPILEFIRAYQSRINDEFNRVRNLAMIRLDGVFNPKNYKYITDFGEAYLIRSKSKIRTELMTLDDEPITRELRPPLLAMRAMDSISTLKAILDMYIQRKLVGFQMHDITDVLYDKTETIKKKIPTTEVALKTKYNVGFASLPLELKALTENGTIDISIKLTLGIDMPDRNSLKRMEKEDIKVQVLTWSESPDVIRYVTIVESDGNYGIWAGFYSNMVFIKPDGEQVSV